MREVKTLMLDSEQGLCVYPVFSSLGGSGFKDKNMNYVLP